MKVIIIIDSTDLYGKERANLQVAHVLKEYGYQVKILINNIASNAIKEEVAAFEYEIVSFPRNIIGKYRIPKYIIAFFKTLFKVGFLLEKWKTDFLLVPTEIALTYLYPILIFSNVIVVFRCGDSPIVNRKTGIICYFYKILWKRLILKRVDRLVCNARFIQEQMVNSGRILKSNDIIIYNYPPIREITDDNVQYLNSDKSLKVGFMGRIVPEKGALELCKAVILANKEGYSTTVYIAGNPNIDSTYSSQIKCLLQKYPEYSNRIIFVGMVNNIDRFYEHIDFVVIPSIYEEPMANVVTEAKLYHKLSVIYNLGGMPEIIQHLKTGYVCENVTVKSLKDAIIYYNKHRDEVIKQGNAAYQSIQELNLDKDSFVRKWQTVFCN